MVGAAVADMNTQADAPRARPGQRVLPAIAPVRPASLPFAAACIDGHMTKTSAHKAVPSGFTDKMRAPQTRYPILMKHKNQLALAAWNLQALSDDYRIAAFLAAHDGSDIHAQIRVLLERLAQGQNAQEHAAALQDRLIDYLWDAGGDDNGEQGALELLAAVEILCRDILYGGERALRRAEQALDYRLDYLSDSTSGGDNPYPAIIRELRAQRDSLTKAPAGSKSRPESGGRESLLALVAAAPPTA